MSSAEVPRTAIRIDVELTAMVMKFSSRKNDGLRSENRTASPTAMSARPIRPDASPGARAPMRHHEEPSVDVAVAAALAPPDVTGRSCRTVESGPAGRLAPPAGL